MAAEMMGVMDRTMRRWRERLQEHDYSGFWDYRQRQPSPKRVPMQTVEQFLQLSRDPYFDFNVQHFYEKLRDVHEHQTELQLSESGPANRRIGEAAEESRIAS